jgi:two-component system, LytTR family, response regulator
MMTAMIIDDEILSAEVLYLIIKKYCPDIQVIYIENDEDRIIESVKKYNPDLLFMDIYFHQKNAFEFIDLLDRKYPIIFTTAHDNHAIRAFKVDAIDYLLKPIDPEELVRAIKKVQVGALSHLLPVKRVYLHRISVANSTGIDVFDTNDIIRFEAAGAYTSLVFLDGRKILASINIGRFEKSCQHTSCLRIHKSHIVNLTYVTKIIKGDTTFLELNHSTLVPISREKKSFVLAAIDEFNRTI